MAFRALSPGFVIDLVRVTRQTRRARRRKGQHGGVGMAARAGASIVSDALMHRLGWLMARCARALGGMMIGVARRAVARDTQQQSRCVTALALKIAVLPVGERQAALLRRCVGVGAH